MQKQPEFVSGNIFVRPNAGVEGDVVAGHTHNFDHTTLFQRGRFAVKATYPDGRVLQREFTAPDFCLIRAEVTHEIRFLEDGEFWCVYAHRDPQGRVVQQYTGWEKAYN